MMLALCAIVLLAAVARASDVLTVELGSGLSAGDARQLASLSALFRWDSSTDKYREAAIHVVDMSEHFRAHSLSTLVHVGAGGLLLCLGPLQFVGELRRRQPGLHRWSGRLTLIAAAAVGLTGLYLGVLVPYAGVTEAVPTALFGSLFLVFALLAYLAVRRKDYMRHREWMLRMIALAVGVGTIRLVGLGLVALGMGLRELIGPSFTIGWVITLLTAEWWIRRNRRSISL